MEPKDTPTSGAVVTPPPACYGLHPFYRKYLDANGIPIVSSEKAPDEALRVAHNIVLTMLSKRPDLQEKMVELGTRVAIIAESEEFLDIPEHKDLPILDPGIDWNTRCRGMGACGPRGHPDMRVCSAAEENILRYPTETHLPGESVLIHEFAHTVWALGIQYIVPPFYERLEKAFHETQKAGKWLNTYAGTHPHEYWAVGTQCWFDAHKRGDNLEYECINQEEILQYDPPLAELLDEYYPSDWKWSQDGGLVKR